MTILKTLLCLTALCSGLTAFAQETAERYLEIRGTTELDQEPLSGATATLYEGSSRLQTVQTGTGGSFGFKLDINKEYTIVLEKDGLIGKRISFNTTLPDEEKGTWMNEFSIGLLRNCPGVDYSALKEPVDKVKFDPKRREFVSDRDYVTRMRPKIENVLVKYESCMMSKYEAAVRKGDEAVASKRYNDAISAYQEALQIYPQEVYPARQINDIKKGQANQQKTAEQQKQQEAMALEDRYNQTLARASVAYTRKDYTAARQYYQEALKIKPEEVLPQTRLQEIESIVTKKTAEEAKARETENAYRAVVQKADSLVRVKQYQTAREQFAKASMIKPGESYPKTRTQEVDRLEAADVRAAETARKATAEKEYQDLLTSAETQYKAKNYEAAQAALLQAQAKRPSDPYPAQRMKAIENTMAAEKQKARMEEVNRQYQEIIAGADQMFRSKDFPSARVAYGRALSARPDDEYAQSRIAAIDNTLAAEAAAKQKSVDDAYKAAIGAASTALSKNALSQARESFERALLLKPADAFATGKIAEVDKLIEQQRKIQEQERQSLERYREAMAAADKLFDAGDLTEARQAYSALLAQKPGDTKAAQRISEIDIRLAASAAERQKKTEESYAAAMAKGAEKQSAKDYPAAKESFQQALAVKPGDVQATARIATVDQLMVQEQEKKAVELKKKKTYDDLIARADALFGQKNYVAAGEVYEQALVLLPAETHPRQKLNEISTILDEQTRQEAATQAMERAYALAMENGDKSMRAKDYAGAKVEYTRAAGLKPGEQNPKDKLAEAEKMIAALKQEQARAKARVEAYTTAMNNGNKLFAAKSYIPARNQYAEALKQMPEDKLAREQIARIDKILAAPVQQAVKTATSPSDQSRKKAAIPMGELNFRTESEKQKYLSELVKNYPDGITLEKYVEPYKETLRYIIVREQLAQEFRQVWFKTYNGYEFTMNGKPITRQYFQSQVKVREGEGFKEIDMQ